MNDNEFRERYAAAQKRIHVSDDLKRRTIAFAEHNAIEGNSTYEPDEPTTRKRPAPRRRNEPCRKPRATWPVRTRWFPAAAACLVAIALIMGATPLVSNLMLGKPLPKGMALEDAAARSGFLVQAYASDNTTTILPGENGMIVFDRNFEAIGDTGDSGTPSSILFTGCLFRIEGEDIARVQMNVSKGELYRQDVEHLTQTEDPERWNEATTWKSTKRGMDGYYSAYDVVYPLSELDASGQINYADSNPIQVQLLKRYGETIDVNAADDPDIAIGKTSFGLYLDTADQSDSEDKNNSGTPEDPHSRALNSFEGQTLTITVTFADGRTTTQVIELHVADFLANRIANHVNITPELASSDEQVDDSHYVIRSVYGTVTSVSEEAFPLPLDNANQYAHEIIPASTIGRQPETNRIKESPDNDAPDAVIDRSLILDAGQTAQIVNPLDLLNNVENPSATTIADLAITRSTTPPEGKTFAEFSFVRGFRDDVAYANQCSEQAFGYHFNEDGTLTSSAHCFLTASFNLTNNSKEAQEFDLATIGCYSLIDDKDGHWSDVNTSYAILNQISSNASLDEYGRHFTINAGETVRIQKTLVVPNWIADNPTLMFSPGRSPDGKRVLFSVADQV